MSTTTARVAPTTVWTVAPAVAPALVRVGPFGPYDLLSDRAHELYVDGCSEAAVQAAREALTVVGLAGDIRTSRYLRYTAAVSLVESGAWDEALEECRLLLGLVDHDDSAWRAKALSVMGDAWVRKGAVSEAIDALAEAYALVQDVHPRAYNELSAAMTVAVSLGHAQLFVPAEGLFARCLESASTSLEGAATRQARVLVLQESALLQATWGAALSLDGRDAEAGVRYERCAQQSLQMMTLCTEDAEMHARAEVMEAFAQSRLGQPELAGARLTAAMARFTLRSELPEVWLARVGLAEAHVLDNRIAEARRELLDVVDAARRTDSLVWSLAAMAALADIDVLEHGSHPAVDWWRRLGRESTRLLWGERESRFVALHDRMSLHALSAEAARRDHDALVDPLTGLGNRRVLDERVQSATGAHAALFVDVDHFKQVNDTFSHDVGDIVLRQVAEMLRTACRSHDVVARYGGDEFVVLLPTTSTGDAAHVAERVHRFVQERRWEDVAPGLTVGVSIGVASHDDPVVALRRADRALLEAKRLGRNQVVVDSPLG